MPAKNQIEREPSRILALRRLRRRKVEGLVDREADQQAHHDQRWYEHREGAGHHVPPAIVPPKCESFAFVRLEHRSKALAVSWASKGPGNVQTDA